MLPKLRGPLRSWCHHFLSVPFSSSAITDGKSRAQFANKRKKLDHTFKEQSLKFLLTDVHYKDMGIPEMPATFISNTIRHQWEEEKISHVVEKLPISKLIHTLYQMQPQDLVKVVDPMLANRLAGLSTTEVLLLSHAALRVFEGRIKDTKFYRLLLCLVPQLVEGCENHRQLVLLAFLSALDRSPRAVKALLSIRRWFEQDPSLIEQLSVVETSILCDSFFKTNVVLGPEQLRVVERLLVCELEAGGLQPVILPLLKVMRKARFGTDRLLERLTALMTSPPTAEPPNAALLAHALAVLADNRFPVPDQLVRNIFNWLPRTDELRRPTATRFVHPAQGVRVKDLTRLTWALSCVRPTVHTLPPSLVETLIQLIDSCWKRGQFHDQWPLVSDFLLSLACWQVYPQHLIENVLDHRLASRMRNEEPTDGQTIRRSRLALFLVAAQIEAPHLNLADEWRRWLHDVRPANVVGDHPTEWRGLKKRMYPASLHQLLIPIADVEGWRDLRCGSVVAHLNIDGITFSSQGYVFFFPYSSSMFLVVSWTPDSVSSPLKEDITKILSFQSNYMCEGFKGYLNQVAFTKSNSFT